MQGNQADDMGESGVIRRKVGAARAGAPPGDPGAARLWRVALARAARDEIGLVLDVHPPGEARLSLAELLELPPERALLALVEGPEDGLGLMALSPGLMAAMVEVQTVGRVAADDPAPRRPTRTDAAMSAAVIDRALGMLGAGPPGGDAGQAADHGWAGGFRYAGFLADPRPLGLLLEDQPYRVLRAGVGIDGGAREGDVLLALPEWGARIRPAVRDAAIAAARDWASGLDAAVRGAEVSLTAVLCRLHLPLEQVLTLAEGAMLPLGAAAPDRVRLETIGGEPVAEARLGQNRGHRALRLRGAEAPVAAPAPAAAAQPAAPGQAAAPAPPAAPRAAPAPAAPVAEPAPMARSA